MREKKIYDGRKQGLLSLSRSRPYHEVDTRGIESRSGESKEVTNVTTSNATCEYFKTCES